MHANHIIKLPLTIESGRRSRRCSFVSALRPLWNSCVVLIITQSEALNHVDIYF